MATFESIKALSEILYREADMGDTVRGRFNAAGKELGLRAFQTGSDGWIRTFMREDGLVLWQAIDRRGPGIQTAWVDDVDGGKAYVDHRMYYGPTIDLALRAAAQREGRA